MHSPVVAIVGAGFTGLTAGLRLSRLGVRVIIVEEEAAVGGLAGSFPVGDARLDKFYHHWFRSDHHVLDLVRELELMNQVVEHPTATGMYFADATYRLSSPLDLLRFRMLLFRDRVRLGRLVLRARSLRDWRPLEGLTAKEWIISEAGEAVYRVLWEPLLRGKFGEYADQVSAVWLWNKLKLRGGSRNHRGQESLLYLRGGFATLAEAMSARIRQQGGDVVTGWRVESVVRAAKGVWQVRGPTRAIEAEAVIVTAALPIAADLLDSAADQDYLNRLRAVEYLANLCVVLELRHSLSGLYWTNVGDPSFPFVGVIEHTNFERPEAYGGRHIVYMSKYLPVSHPLWARPDPDLVSWVMPYLSRMFPGFDPSSVVAGHVWRARYAQPVVVRHYGSLLPDMVTPMAGLFLATMAQIYPEDRGTNYAVRDGTRVAELVGHWLRARGSESTAGRST